MTHTITITADRIAAAKWYLNNFDVPGFTRDVEATDDDAETLIADGDVSDMYAKLADFAYANFYVSFGHLATEARNGAEWARERCDAILAQIFKLTPYPDFPLSYHGRLCELIAAADVSTPDGGGLRDSGLPADARFVERA